MLQETFHHDDSILPNMPLTHYFFHTPGKKQKKSGRAAGGLITLIKKSSTRVEPEKVFENMNVLALKCSFFECQIPVLIINVYRGSSASPIFDTNFINFLSERIDENRCGKVIMAGDFNAKFGSWQSFNSDEYEFDFSSVAPVKSVEKSANSMGIQILNLANDNGLKVVYAKGSDGETALPTLRKSKAVLDVFFVDGFEEEFCRLLDSPWSDHFAVESVLRFRSNAGQAPESNQFEETFRITKCFLDYSKISDI